MKEGNLFAGNDLMTRSGGIFVVGAKTIFIIIDLNGSRRGAVSFGINGEPVLSETWWYTPRSVLLCRIANGLGAETERVFELDAVARLGVDDGRVAFDFGGGSVNPIFALGKVANARTSLSVADVGTGNGAVDGAGIGLNRLTDRDGGTGGRDAWFPVGVDPSIGGFVVFALIETDCFADGDFFAWRNIRGDAKGISVIFVNSFGDVV